MENTDVYVNVCWVQIRWNSYVIEMVWLQESHGWICVEKQKHSKSVEPGKWLVKHNKGENAE